MATAAMMRRLVDANMRGSAHAIEEARAAFERAKAQTPADMAGVLWARITHARALLDAAEACYAMIHWNKPLCDALMNEAADVLRQA